MKGRSIAAALVIVFAGAAWYLYGGGRTPAGQPPLESVTAQNAGPIKNEFNAAKDEVRVLLLLSPT